MERKYPQGRRNQPQNFGKVGGSQSKRKVGGSQSNSKVGGHPSKKQGLWIPKQKEGRRMPKLTRGRSADPKAKTGSDAKARSRSADRNSARSADGIHPKTPANETHKNSSRSEGPEAKTTSKENTRFRKVCGTRPQNSARSADPHPEVGGTISESARRRTPSQIQGWPTS